MTRTRVQDNPQRFFQQAIDRSPSLQMVFRQFEIDNRKREASAAKADPKANRLTRVFDPGVAPSYRYWPTKTKPEIRFCWTVNRNAAGRYLIFRERVRRDRTVRDQFEAILEKRAAIRACKLNRDDVDAQRAKAAAKRAQFSKPEGNGNV